MRISILAAAAVVLTAVPATAQQPTLADSLLDRFVGRWELRGTIAGQPTVHDVTAEWVLAHQYVHVHEVSREKNPSGQPQYEADVYIGWDAPARQYLCFWLDVFGGSFDSSIARATRQGDSIPFVFTDSAGRDAFHTTFAWRRATNDWEWRMDNVQNGELKPFARMTMTRR